jgi:hypothetical protein
MTQDVPHPKTSAHYWTGSGMSVNRVLNGTTKKQQNTQRQERVNCLKKGQQTQMGEISNPKKKSQ